jgi:prolyl-tRNA synthetase
MKVFSRLGIGDDTFITFASGGAFTQFSHEFQTVCEAGEDMIYLNREKNIAINHEVMSDETLQELGVSRDDLVETTTAEVGNIFNFGRQKAEDLGLTFVDETGTQIPVWMGSYGIGITRLMGVIVEKFHDENGIIWPKSISPFAVHLISLKGGEERAEKLYSEFTNKGVEVMWDDRDISAGAKFADADLIGIPIRLVLSGKTEAGKVEWKERGKEKSEVIGEEEVMKRLWG